MSPARLWPAALIAVLAITVLANLFLLRAAHDPRAYVVEPDYYRRAVAWDSILARQRLSDRLGWRLDTRLSPAGSAPGALLETRLTDRDGAPVAAAAFHVTAIHNADPGRRVEAEFVTDPNGEGRIGLPLSHAGLWELRFEARRGAQRFLTSVRVDAGPAAGAEE